MAKRSKGKKSGSSPRRTLRFRIVRALVVLTLLVGAATAVLWQRCGIAGCPDPRALVTYRPGGAPVLLDRNGDTLTSLHPLERDVVALEDLPDYVPEAFVAVEDKRFWNHFGVDPIRVLGAALYNLRRSDGRQGASTITMQLARSIYPDRLPRADRTMRRKLLETRVALGLESAYSKPALLELYLNHVYFGGGTHGIEAAAHYYFDHPASELTLEEAALLAGMVQSPARTDPRRAPERAIARRNVVLTLMEEQERAPSEAAADARDRPLGVDPEPPAPASPGPAPYFVETVRAELEDVLGGDAYTAGLRVHTTLDTGAQEAAESALSARLQQIEAGAFGPYGGPAFDPSVPGGPGGTDYLQGAVVVMERETGDVLALVGGRDFGHSRFNRATNGRRPVGSAFKPVVVLSALREGFVASQPLSDRPFELVQEGAEAWSPRNYDRDYHGTVSVREALVRSLNIPIARLALAVGVEPIVETVRELGVDASASATPALALGTIPLSPLQLASLYRALAPNGRPGAPRMIRRVEDGAGRVVYDGGSDEGEPLEDPPIDPRITYLVTDMLEDAVSRGTGTGVRSGGFSGVAAGKTGTTQDGADAWFAGYTPRLVATVWIGHDRPRSILPGASGGGLAAPVWGRIVAGIEARESAPARWSRPEGLVERTVDPRTGLVLETGCELDGRDPVVELFLDREIPDTACPESPGFFSRIANTVRGWFGGDDDQEERPDDTSEQRLDARSGVDEMLGTERLRATPR